MANKKSSVKKTTTKTKKVTSSAKNNAELYENSNSNLIVKIIIAIVLILAVVLGLVKACEKDDEKENKKDKKPVTEVIKKQEEENKTDDNGLKSLEDNGYVYVSNLTNEVKKSSIKQVVKEEVKNASKEEVKDTKAPVVTGVSEGEVGSVFVINAIDDKTSTNNLVATIDGMPYTLGEEYRVNGNHTLVVKDETGNVTVINFTIVTKVNANDSLNAVIANANDGDIILLNENVNEGLITIDKKIVLDLNGKTLNITASNAISIIVNDELTIKDSAGTGKIETTSSLVSDNALITVESGNINVTDDYAIYCRNGGKAVINGGVITSSLAVLTGNNATGSMEFTVNGGTLTAKYGPAVYMPGPVSLTVTGGTLNGGISLRMGIVNISGGTINAVTQDIDLPKDYYSYSGNAWLPDAIYVFGGTYLTNVSGANNNLELNITGGTINCANGVGSAVAIYNLGKVAQKMNVAISSSANLITNGQMRKAFDVLSLSDIGVTNPKPGFGLIPGDITLNVAEQYR